MEKLYYVYILTTQKNTVLYTGITSDLVQRIWQHKEGLVEGFTKKYNVCKLIYFEEYKNVQDAIHREKCIKRWKRAWKVELIGKMNPKWKDLNENDLIPASAGMTTMEDTRIAR
ncbi:MAG: GIY-YIG nuclease family protein [Alphaproteobacteria bacterium]|nr:GIY-YIG nuclease family protein [Alphaproteobacteria bacterium]